VDEVAQALRAALGSAVGAAPSPLELDAPLAAAARAAQARYDDRAWTWRR
jgi:hypothetical protein